MNIGAGKKPGEKAVATITLLSGLGIICVFQLSMLSTSPVIPDKDYPILCDPMDCSPPGSSVHGISQARILE